MSKTTKNKVRQTVTWPTTPYFTLMQLWKDFNPKFKEITLRVRLVKSIEEDGIVAEIGYIPGTLGRPQKVYAMTPVTKETLTKAKENGIELVEKAEEKFLGSVSISSTQFPTNIVNPVNQPA